MVEVDGSALDGTAAVSLGLGRVEVQLVALPAVALGAFERFGGGLSVMAPEGVAGSGKPLGGGGAFVGGVAAGSSCCISGA
jgi:hypothetical protein